MGSINRQLALRREIELYDNAHAAQAMPKDVNKYVKTIRKDAGMSRRGAYTDKQFLVDIGGGI